ncbi:MAG: superinfection immunity protein [Methyloligellaceae bacterium]
METLTTIIYWLIPTTIYFGPSIIAVCRHHYRARYIVLANLLFGWTIVGLFVTFAWSLSSTRRIEDGTLDTPPTDFGERLFHNRNIIRQPDGGAIVYPGYLSEEAYWLDASDFARYRSMRAEESRRNFPRGLVLLIGGSGFFLGFRQWMGPEHGTAPALVLFTALVMAVAAWDLVMRPRREFLSEFPKAPRAKDPIRRHRKLLATLVAFDPVICIGATALCSGLIVSFLAAMVMQSSALTLRAHDGAMLLLGLAILSGGAAFYGHLVWHHLVFLLQNRRTPTQIDLEALGTGVKPTKASQGTSIDPTEAHPDQSRSTSSRGLAAALRLGLRGS